MDSSSLDFALNVPWVAAYAAEPFELLRVVYPHLNASTLPPPTNPIRIARHYLDKRASCGTTNNGGSSNGNSNGGSSSNSSSKKSSNSGVLIGAVVGAVVGTAIIAGLIFWFYRRSQRNKKQQQQQNGFNNPSNGNTPFKDETPAMPTPFILPGQQPVGGGTPPPPTNSAMGMKQVSPYDIPGLGYNNNPVMYPAPASTIGSGPASSYGNPSEAGGGSYYNYAPPPPSSPQPTISSGTGISYYAGTPAPPFMSHLSSTPSPPPPSMTSGPTSTYSGVTSHTSYQPWAVPLDEQAQAGANYTTTAAGGGSATGIPGVFPAGAFPTAQEEKAHFSGWQSHPQQQMYSPGASGSGSGSGFPSGPTSEKAGLSIASPAATADSGPTASGSSGAAAGRQGAASLELDTSGRTGATSPTPGLPPPAYSPQ